MRQSLFVHGFFESLSQLIGAGSGFGSAVNTLDLSDDILNLHSINERADALQVAVTAAYEGDILYSAVLNFKEDLSGAGALGFVRILHDDFSFLYFVPSAVHAVQREAQGISKTVCGGRKRHKHPVNSRKVPNVPDLNGKILYGGYYMIESFIVQERKFTDFNY